jgi:hypothetical protein
MEEVGDGLDVISGRWTQDRLGHDASLERKGGTPALRFIT